MKTFDDFGVAVGNTPQSTNTDGAVELAVTTYSDLGLIGDEGRAREAFGEAIEEFETAYAEVSTGPLYDMVLVPKLGELTFGSLKDRYDQLTGQKGNPQTYIWDDLWGRYSAEELNQGQEAPIEARAVLLGGENDYNEAGLYFTSQTLEEQRESLRKAQGDYEEGEMALDSMSVPAYMIRNAMLLERGEQLMDRPTYTRFVALEAKEVDGASYVPVAYSSVSGQVYLRESREVAGPNVGVRLSVGQKA